MTAKFLVGVFSLCFLLMGVTIAENENPQESSHQESEHWTEFPLIEPEKGRSRKQAVFETVNYSAPIFDIYPSVEVNNKGKSWQANVVGSLGTLETQGQGGYYWIIGAEEEKGKTISASTVHYFSNPGPAPRTMLSTSKSELEISPPKLPREHSGFRANETWEFRVFSKGEALANTKVLFESSNGTKIDYHSNSKGIIRVKFPNDFKKQNHSENGGHRRVKASFVLAVEHKDNLSTFNYNYTPDAYANRSRTMGVLFLFLGMLVASPLVFGKKKVRS